MVKHAAIWGVAAALAFTLSACDGDDEPPSRASHVAAGEVEEGDRLVDIAKRDLVNRFGYDEADIRVVSVESVTWPDGALGCPRLDRAYTQALVDGYRIVLQWKDVEHPFHGKSGSDPFLCEKLD